MRCDEARQESAAFVLGDLNGPERAEFVGHLSGCAVCQGEVAELTMTLDRLDHAVRPVFVSPGFVERVMAGIAPQPDEEAPRRPARGSPARSRPRAAWRRGDRARRRVAVVVAAAAVGAAAAGVAVASDHAGGGRPRSPGASNAAPAPAAVADLRTSAGVPVGEVVVFDRPRPWVSVSLAVPTGTASLPLGPYVVVVDRMDGRPSALGKITLLDGRGALGASPGVATSEIADVLVETPGGGNLCSGFLRQPDHAPPTSPP